MKERGRKQVIPPEKALLYRKKRLTDEHRAKMRAARAKRHSFIADYKVREGCRDCGYNVHHAALQFDHIGQNKEISIGNIKSMGKFWKEVVKCEVVCSNCHAIRTYARLHLAKGLSDTGMSNKKRESEK